MLRRPSHRLRLVNPRASEDHPEITDHCPRCVMTTLAQAGLPKDNGILRTVARENDVHVGVYAKVLRGGAVHKGDPVTLA